MATRVHVDEAVFDVMKIYRTHQNESMRRMALVALGHMDSSWAIGFLTRAQKFEKSPVLLHTLQAVVNDYHERHSI